MDQIRRSAFLKREFGLCFENGEWLYSGICITNHSYMDLYEALTQLMMITTWEEYSRICFYISHFGVSLFLNSSPPLGIMIEESDWEDVEELMDQMTDSGEWRISEICNGPYVLDAAGYYVEMLIPCEN